MSLDQWREDPSYNRDKTYILGSNKYGVSKDIHVNVPPEIMGAVAAVVNNPGTEYQNYSHGIRDAIIHWLHYWSGRLPEVKDKVTLALVFAEVESRKQHERHLKALVEELEEALKHADFSTTPPLLEQAERLRSILTPGTRWYSDVEFLLDKYRCG